MLTPAVGQQICGSGSNSGGGQRQLCCWSGQKMWSGIALAVCAVDWQLQWHLLLWRGRLQICSRGSSSGSSSGNCSGIGYGSSIGSDSSLMVVAAGYGLVGAGGVLGLHPCNSCYLLAAQALPLRLALCRRSHSHSSGSSGSSRRPNWQQQRQQQWEQQLHWRRWQ